VIVGRSCRHMAVCSPAAPENVASTPAAKTAATTIHEPRAIVLPNSGAANMRR
jgi:hypothetical protein